MDSDSPLGSGPPNQPVRVRSLKPTASPGTIAVSAAVAVLLFFSDQAVKNFIVGNYVPNELIAGSRYVSLVFVTNVGGVCGYAQGAGTLLAGIGVLTAVAIVASVLLFMPDSRVHGIAFGMLLGGASGNLADRLRFGYVIDYLTLDLLRWPSFNIADASIVGGVAVIGFLTLWEEYRLRIEEAGRQPQHPGRDHQDRYSIILLVILVGLLAAASYLFCVVRPFG